MALTISRTERTDVMKYKIAQFMAGRNGTDDLSRFESIVALVAVILSYIIGKFVSSNAGAYICSLLWMLGIVLLVLCYVRTFSKKLQLRYEQNQRFLRKRAKFKSLFKSKKTQFDQRKDYRFFNCPSCKSTMRVPRGKGKVKIVCRKCGEAFIRKT